MLLELLINLFFGLAKMIITLLPDLSLQPGSLNILADIAQIMDGASYVLPMGTFLFCLSVFFVLHNATFFLSILNWIIRKIPGVA